MPEPAVVDASPLIVLGRAHRMELLQLLGPRVLVPTGVATEIRAHSDEAARSLDAESWIEEVTPNPMPEVVASWGLGSGESAVLSWACAHPGTIAVIDDYAARTCASVLGIPVRGTLGLALLAKQRGDVTSAGALVDELRRAGLYLSDDLIRNALSLVAE